MPIRDFWRLVAAGAVLVVLSCGGGSPTNSGGTSTGQNPPTAQATVIPSASSEPGIPPDNALPQCSQGWQTGGTLAGTPSTLQAVRVAAHVGFDRIVFQMNGSGWQFGIYPQASPQFTNDPKGDTVTLQGTSGLRVVMRGVQNHDQSGASVVSTIVLLPGGELPAIKGVQQISDSEGMNGWALGLGKPACARYLVLSNPNRLVVDIQS